MSDSSGPATVSLSSLYLALAQCLTQSRFLIICPSLASVCYVPGFHIFMLPWRSRIWGSDMICITLLFPNPLSCNPTLSSRQTPELYPRLFLPPSVPPLINHYVLPFSLLEISPLPPFIPASLPFSLFPEIDQLISLAWVQTLSISSSGS